MKNLGELKYFLGIEVARSRLGIFLSQRKYVLYLLSEVGLLDYRPADTQIIWNHKLREYPNQVPTEKGRYIETFLSFSYMTRHCLRSEYSESVYALSK